MPRIADRQPAATLVYHGAAQALSTFRGFSLWGSTSKDLARDYALDHARSGGDATIEPLYFQINTPFDANALPDALTVHEFFASALAQSHALGVQPDDNLVGRLRHVVLAGAHAEDSVGTLSPQDFWHTPRSRFGPAGQEALKILLDHLGFDGVRATEMGDEVFGVFRAQQVTRADGKPYFNSTPTPVLVNEQGTVLDMSGRPAIVYHGTSAEFAEFNPGLSSEGGIFFASNPRAALAHAEMSGSARLVRASLQMNRPYIINYENRPFDEGLEALLRGLVEHFASTGAYDGIVAHSIGDAPDSSFNTLHVPVGPGQMLVPDLAAWSVDNKACNADGSPIKVYHGTDANFELFDMEMACDGAHFFTDNPEHALSFGAVKAYYTRIVNPLVITQDDLEKAWDDHHPDGEQDDDCLLPRDFVETFVREAKASDYDGLIIKGMADKDLSADMYLPFSAEQVQPIEVFAPKNEREITGGTHDVSMGIHPSFNLKAAHPYPEDGLDTEVRRVARGVKYSDQLAIEKAAADIAAILPPGAVIIPIPNADGTTTKSLELAQAVARRTGAQIKDILYGESRDSQYERKKGGKPLLADEMRMFASEELTMAHNTFLIDNVAGTGETIRAARTALGVDIPALVYAAEPTLIDRVLNSHLAKQSAEIPAGSSTQFCARKLCGAIAALHEAHEAFGVAVKGKSLAGGTLLTDIATRRAAAKKEALNMLTDSAVSFASAIGCHGGAIEVVRAGDLWTVCLTSKSEGNEDASAFSSAWTAFDEFISQAVPASIEVILRDNTTLSLTSLGAECSEISTDSLTM